MRTVIVGGGITGMFTAYYLSIAGHHVTLIDSLQSAAAQTSIYNAGFITPSTGVAVSVGLADILLGFFGNQSPVYISLLEVLRNLNWFRTALGKSLSGFETTISDFGRTSLQLYEAFFAKEGISVDLVRGIAGLYSRAEVAMKLAKDFGGIFLDQDEVRRIGFQGIGGGIYTEDELSINPLKLFASLRKILTDRGVRILLGRPARLERKNARVASAILSNQEIEGDCYVIAAGAWSKELLKDLGYDSPILPARGLAMLFDTKGDKIIEAPALLEDLGIAVAQHDPNTLRVSGFFEMVGFNDSFKDRKKQWMLDRAREHITKFSKLNLVQEGVGYRPCTPDQLPIIGQVPGIENAYVASGNCRLGVTLAPATARLIQRIIENEHEVNADKEFSKSFDPSRFGN